MQRYNRHSLIDWFDQQKLRDTRIVVVGAGAVGNEVLKNLTLLGVGHIRVFDFDKIEEHNLTRCVLFREADIGCYKADAAAASCQHIDPNLDILASNTDFWHGLTLAQVAESNAVVCCVDNFEARLRLNQLCLMTGTDYYNTAIDSRFITAEVFPYSTQPDCACYACTLPTSVYSTMQKRYSCGWLKKASFEEKKIPTTTLTSSLAGAAVTSLILNRLSNHPEAFHYAARYFQDAISLAVTVSQIQPNDDCPTCQLVDPRALRMTTKRSCAHKPIALLAQGNDTEVILSEPVLIRGTCTICHRQQEYFASTRQTTDAVTFCSICSKNSISTEFVERLSPTDFAKTFAGRDLPCKFLTYHAANQQVILEMED